MKFGILVLLSLLACVLAKGNSSQLECHSILKGSLKLAGSKGNHTQLVANVNTNSSTATSGSGLLAKADKPLHAEVFKCNHYPHTKEANGELVQLRAHGQCATITHSGFGVELGLQFDKCADKVSNTTEQWFSTPAPITGLDHAHQVVPVSLAKKGKGLLSVGIVSSFADALAFSYAQTRNSHATELTLVLDTK